MTVSNQLHGPFRLCRVQFDETFESFSSSLNITDTLRKPNKNFNLAIPTIAKHGSPHCPSPSVLGRAEDRSLTMSPSSPSANRMRSRAWRGGVTSSKRSPGGGAAPNGRPIQDQPLQTESGRARRQGPGPPPPTEEGEIKKKKEEKRRGGGA